MSIPIFSKEHIVLKPKEQKLVKAEAPFIKEIWGLAIVKILDKQVQNIIFNVIMTLKLKFTQNSAALNVTNSSLETVIFDLKEMFGILNLKSLWYYKIKQGILQQNLSKFYRFEVDRHPMWAIQNS